MSGMPSAPAAAAAQALPTPVAMKFLLEMAMCSSRAPSAPPSGPGNDAFLRRPDAEKETKMRRRRGRVSMRPVEGGRIFRGLADVHFEAAHPTRNQIVNQGANRSGAAADDAVDDGKDDDRGQAKTHREHAGSRRSR